MSAMAPLGLGNRACRIARSHMRWYAFGRPILTAGMGVEASLRSEAFRTTFLTKTAVAAGIEVNQIRSTQLKGYFGGPPA